MNRKVESKLTRSIWISRRSCYAWPSCDVTRDAREKIAFFAFHAFVVADSRFQQNRVRAILRPLLKKPTTDHKVFANFRPVSNFKYSFKLIEKAVAVQLNDHLACNDLHVPFQSAYRSCHSTESALMRVFDTVHNLSVSINFTQRSRIY